MKTSYQFPDNFLWGVAAASAQIEGAAFEDGKGESIWDRFPQKAGAVVGGDNPSIACDHYHRYPEDIALIRNQLGVEHYRLSIAWPRLYPTGTGKLNQKGLDFYDRLIDECLQQGVKPWVTLFHWDLPQALEDKNGWLNRATVDAFRVYCETVVKHFSDRVDKWFTVNELPCFIGLGYEDGVHAPGRREGLKLVNQAYHHGLLAHGHAVSVVREYGGPNAQVGIVHNPPTPIPFTETPADIEAAQSNYRLTNGQIMAPLFSGEYPAEWLEREGGDAPQIQDGDMKLIGQPTDFFGLNLYAGYFMRADENGQTRGVPFGRQFPVGDLPWIKVTPQTLYWAIRHAKEVYGVKSFYITENGSAFEDSLIENDVVIDLDRREYLRNYLIGLHRACEEGFDVRGYFVWSLMDNYEWAEGYAKRFGIVRVDYKTQKRTPKLSAQWYRKVVEENRIV